MAQFSPLSQLKIDSTIGIIVPLIQQYVRVLRENYPYYPRRVYSRHSQHKIAVIFSVDLIRLQNGMEAPGPINISIEMDDVLEFHATMSSSVIVGGIQETTALSVDVCQDGRPWYSVLEEQIPYLIREAQLY